MSCCQMIVVAVRAGINCNKCLRFSGGCGVRQREKSWLCRYTGLGRGHSLLENLNFCVALSPPLREKDDKHKTWMPKFLMAKEDKDQRKSSGDVERSWFSFCVFPCCQTLYACLWSHLQEWDAPDWAHILCWLLLHGPFPLNPAFRRLCRRYLEGKTNSWIWALCERAGDTLRVSSWSCIVSSHLANKKVLLAIHLAAFLPCSGPFLLQLCLDSIYGLCGSATAILARALFLEAWTQHSNCLCVPLALIWKYWFLGSSFSSWVYCIASCCTVSA